MQENIQTYEKTFVHNDIEYMKITITLPMIESKEKGSRRLNHFYSHKVKQITAIVVKKLLPLAKAELQSALDGSASFKCWQIDSFCKITYKTDHILSILRETTVFKGRKKYTEFSDSETWNLNTVYLIRLKSIISSKNIIFNSLRTYAEKDKKLEKHLLSRFSYDNYYLTDEGIIVYFPGTAHTILLHDTCKILTAL